MKYLIVFILVFVFGFGTTSLAQDAIGIVKSAQGLVTIDREARRQPAEVGDQLQATDVIETGPNGSFGAILKDGTTIAAGQNSRIAFARYQFEPGLGAFELLLRVLRGRVIYGSGRIGEAAPDRVRIETPRLSIGTRGTRFAVIVP